MSAIRRIDPSSRLPGRAAQDDRLPAEHVTLTAGSRKRLRHRVPHRKVGRGKVGVGGKRSGT